MQLKDITILRSLNPITVENKPSKKTIEFLAGIFQIPHFKEYDEAVRLMRGVTTEDVSIKKYVGKNFSEIPEMNSEILKISLQKTISDLCKELGISDNFNTQIFLLLFFHAFVDLEHFEGFITQPIQFILGRKNIAISMFDYPHEVGAIVVPFNLSQRALIKWIEDNWSNIEKQLDENLTTDPYLLRYHKNTELALEITALKNDKKLTFTEITDMLSKKYPDDERLTNESTVKKIYYEYQSLVNTLVTAIKK